MFQQCCGNTTPGKKSYFSYISIFCFAKLQFTAKIGHLNPPKATNTLFETYCGKDSYMQMHYCESAAGLETLLLGKSDCFSFLFLQISEIKAEADQLNPQKAQLHYFRHIMTKFQACRCRGVRVLFRKQTKKFRKGKWISVRVMLRKRKCYTRPPDRPSVRLSDRHWW